MFSLCIAVYFVLQRFRDWLDKHGPFDLTLDGANLAFWGENYEHGSFKAWKIRVAYDHMQALYPQAKLLVVSGCNATLTLFLSSWGEAANISTVEKRSCQGLNSLGRCLGVKRLQCLLCSLIAAGVHAVIAKLTSWPKPAIHWLSRKPLVRYVC